MASRGLRYRPATCPGCRRALGAGLALLLALLAGCAKPPVEHAQASMLIGGWTSGGPSFDFVIRRQTILFEFDMKEHPYRLEGDVLVIDFEDPSLGVQRKRIVRLSATELELEDLASGSRSVYTRMSS